MRGERHFGQSFLAGAKGLLLASLGSLSSGSPWGCTGAATEPAPLKPFKPSPARWMPAEKCYACGAEMVEIQTCKFRCPRCGALLDCEDIAGLPK